VYEPLTPVPPPRRPPPAIVVYLLGIVGGLAGVVAAVYQEIRQGGGLLLPLLIGPVIEEVCKPIGVIFMLEKRFGWLRSARQVVVLSAMGALVFATIENLVYVHIVHLGGGRAYVLWRYIICTAMHLVASIVFGLGLARVWWHIHRKRGGFDIDLCLRYFIVAVAIHAVYNTTVTVLELTGLLKF